MNKPLYLGIEIGGTKLQIGVGAGDGSAQFTVLVRREVDRAAGADGILQQIAEVAPQLATRYSLAGMGIGFGGPVDAVTGRVTKSHQIAGWEGRPLAAWCADLLGIPAVVGNDCDCAALAEARYGAGRGGHTVLYVTIGTGIGGGLIIDGQLHGRNRPAVAEIGHLRPGTRAITPAQTVEALAAGPGIALTTRQRLAAAASPPEVRQDLLRRCNHAPEQLTAQLVAEAAADGNAIARATLDQAIQTLGWAIAQTITLTAADRVVLGGGVSLIGETHFFAPLREQVRSYVFPPLAGSYELLPAALGEAVVVHGALALAADAAHPGDRAAAGVTNTP